MICLLRAYKILYAFEFFILPCSLIRVSFDKLQDYHNSKAFLLIRRFKSDRRRNFETTDEQSLRRTLGRRRIRRKKKEKSFEAPPRTRNSFLRPYSSHRKTKRRPRRKPRQNFSMPFAKASFDKWRKRSPNPNAAKIQPLIRRRSFIPAIYFEKFIGRPAIVIWRGNVFYSLHTYIMHLSLHI